MKVMTVLLTFLLFAGFKGFVLDETGAQEFDFPELVFPELQTRDIGSCDSISGCIGMVGNGIANIAFFLLFVGQFIVEVLSFLLSVAVLIGQITFAGFGEGTPAFVNVIFNTFFAGFGALWLYVALRKGDTDV